MNADTSDDDLEVVLRSSNDTSIDTNVLAIIDDADYRPEEIDFQHEYVLTEII